MAVLRLATLTALLALLGCQETPPLPTVPSPAPGPPPATSRVLRPTVTPAGASLVLSPDAGDAIIAVDGALVVPLNVTGGGTLCATADGYEGQCVRVVLPLEGGALPPPIALVAIPPIDGCARADLLDTLRCARALYPEPMSASDRGSLMNLVAYLHRTEGWGLHLKPGGNRCPQPVTGVDISCDILVDGAGEVHDVLIDEEIVPDRIGSKGQINDPANFVAPVRPPCAGPCR